MNSTRDIKIDSVDVQAWASEMHEAAQTKKNKVKPVIHPIFQEAKEYLTDPFWIAKFEQASRGKFPPKITYHNQRLSKKGQKQIYLDLTSDPQEAKERILGFFMAHSPYHEAVKEEAIIPAPPSTEESITWAKANKKIQEALKSYYITDQKVLHNLTKKELHQLRQILNFGLVNKIFNKTTIHVTNKRIVSIDGLTWDEDSRQYVVDPQLVKMVTSRAGTKCRESNLLDEIPSKDTVPQFSLRLNKYLDSLERKLRESEQHATRFLGYQAQIEGHLDFDLTEEEMDEDDRLDDDFDINDEFD